jgi:hypothetical protein
MCLAEKTTPTPENEDLNRLPSFTIIFLFACVCVRDVLCVCVHRVLCVHACVPVLCLCMRGVGAVFACVCVVCA